MGNSYGQVLHAHLLYPVSDDMMSRFAHVGQKSIDQFGLVVYDLDMLHFRSLTSTGVRAEICAYGRTFRECILWETGGQRVVIHSSLGSGKSFLGLRGSPISSTVSLNSGTKMKKFWGLKNPRERTMAESLANGGENMLADVF
jgi:hypothetical protein